MYNTSMGILFVIVCMYVLYISISETDTELNTSLNCNDRKEPHDWIIKEQDEDTYMDCSVCKKLTGEGFEEG